MAKTDTQTVGRLLQEYARRAALRGGNPYSAKAYARAAENLTALAEPLGELVAEGRLQEIPGIGNSIADIITKLHRTGTHPSLEAMRKEVPAGVLELMDVPGLRPDKVMKLYKTLGISSLAELEQAARDDRIKGTQGLGASLQTKILNNIEIAKSGENRRHVHRAAALLDSALKRIKAAKPDLKRVTVAGDLRRGCELIGDLALVAEADRLDDGPKALTPSGELNVHLADREHYGASLLFATGSAAHIEALKVLAGRKGFTLHERGFRRGRKLVAAKTEEQIYKALELPFIEPELREDGSEIALALERKLPKLVSDADIRGILHAHTDRSDGVDTLAAMAAATRKRGYQYFGVADHSKSAHYAGGLSVAEIREQHREINKLNKGFGKDFRIFKGIESDILEDGSLDYPKSVLARFDFVVASVHSRFKLGRKEQTERIIRAVSHPRTTILGHMTGRQLLRRPGYDVDIEKVLKACAKHGVAVEINANPWRLDLDWRWHRRALELGCMMSINPDAHSTNEIDLTHWGVQMARKGGVPTDRILNCLPLAEFTRFLRLKKKQDRTRTRHGSTLMGARRHSRSTNRSRTHR
ncbi:MAG: polymerase [Hyphomicrobiales bacterium]|jgi:DNA polymerase (family 10)|nr:polymerase [Hyphomicrobiales bacterium]